VASTTRAERRPGAEDAPASEGAYSGRDGDEKPPSERDGATGGRGAALSSILTDAAVGPGQRWFPGLAGARLAARLVLRPGSILRRGAGAGVELGRIAVGRSEVAPSERDRRFKDPAWSENPVFRAICQAYLTTGQALDGLIGDAGLDWRSERRVRFAVENVLDALAPTNAPVSNPAVLKAVIDSGGRNVATGARRLARDLSKRRLPEMVDKSAFEVGENLAVTPGAVVMRTPVFELIQYEPQTERVRQAPLLVVPPMINKFYVADIAADRSLIEHAVRAEHQVFAMSWRNPDERHAEWGFDTYSAAVLEALDAVEAISRSSRTQTLGLCAGGMVLSAVAAHLAARDELERLAGMSLGVCVLDNERMGTAGAFVERATAATALAESARRGYLDGRGLAGVFAWLRPNDLVWGYWVNNYLLGKEPPPFDVLYWNADATNMPAALHRDFMELALDNKLVKPGTLEVLGTPVDLGKVDVDSYAVAGIADHITPWQSCYRTTQLLGSSPRFVLSTSGHIAAVVNPPGNEKASFRTAEENPEDAERWLASATQSPGSWWEDWVTWLGKRSGRRKAAPQSLGREGLEPLDPAPGTYVHEHLPGFD
jgi:polyhydroxyalkanoate synthase subunit PhaC